MMKRMTIPTHTGTPVFLESTTPTSVISVLAQNHLSLNKWISSLYVGLGVNQTLNLVGKPNVLSAWVLFQVTMELPSDSWILVKLSELSTSSQDSDGVVLQLNTFPDHQLLVESRTLIRIGRCSMSECVYLYRYSWYFCSGSVSL